MVTVVNVKMKASHCTIEITDLLDSCCALTTCNSLTEEPVECEGCGASAG